ncbi:MULTISPECIES: acetolactate decarboxylase [unclassified Acetobacterium]|jgi:acetolactate decarboxylase|uniref:acetolactate decarboxylase n=1 Tax=unclassified Acetobacterium TaxID=2638182 RepID=UPI000DBECB73|nr:MULTISPECIES: acetolactate decarboxylase [unclassified Acetobacterium]AWW25607.1 acetolactate decarboxylase [Acetobacterium sp. KB-1]MDZ5724553.1 acetolactate decarboxylase [Acetobacterium sp. K1/6]
MKIKFTAIVLSVLCVVTLGGCAGTTTSTSSDAVASKEETLFQASTINSLLAGNYDGFMSFGELKQHGDVGIGTFDALDGELVMIENTIYKVKASGEVVEVPDTDTTPFAAVTYFNEDVTKSLEKTASLDALEQELDKLMTDPASFYVFRIDGTFNTVKARSVPSQQKPYSVLSEAVKNQSIFDYQKISGTLVGLWCPEDIGDLNVKGYHFHFISDDRSKGGHLLDVSFDSAKAFMDQTDGFFMTLSPTSPEGTVDDAESAIDAVEK